jgi:hypothetical protein
MRSAGSPTPWTRVELLTVTGVNAIALVLLTVAFAASSHTATFNGQIAWLNLAVVGLTLGFAADAALFFVARRTIGRRRLRVRPNVMVTARTDHETGKEGPWVWLPGTARAHRTSCPMVVGKRSVAADIDLIHAQRLIRCEVCEC